MKTILNILHCFILAVGLFFSSCQSSSTSSHRNLTQKDRESQVIRLNIKDEPQTLDRQARDLSAMTLIRMLFEGLTRVNPKGDPELALAEKVETSSDLKTWTFFLRKARWTNGDPISAHDFVSTWKQCLDPLFPSDMASQLYVIKNARLAKEGKALFNDVGIHALDSQTLQIELECPTPYFLSLIASPPFFPVHPQMNGEKSDTLISNGPFSLKKWKHQDHLELVKNKTYWDAQAVQLKGLQLIMVPEDTELMMFEKQELDWAGSPLSFIPVEAIKAFAQKNKLKSQEMLGTHFLRINTQSPPLNHPKMRQALSVAIDRQSIIDHVVQGNQTPATGIVPIALGLRKTPYFEDGNIQQARQLFQEALDELKLSAKAFSNVVLLYRATERNHLIAQALQQQWFQAFGMRIQLESMEGKVYFDRVSKQDYQLAISSWVADFEDPINFLEVFKYKEGRSNNTFWENPLFASLLDQSLSMVDPIKRYALLADAEQILVQEMPLIPLFYYNMLYMNRDEIQGVVLSKSGQLDFKWAYVDKKAKR